MPFKAPRSEFIHQTLFTLLQRNRSLDRRVQHFPLDPGGAFRVNSNDASSMVVKGGKRDRAWRAISVACLREVEVSKVVVEKRRRNLGAQHKRQKCSQR